MRRRRSPARWLAPVAIVACAFAIYSVVDHELGSDSKSGTTSSGKTGTGTDTGTTTGGKPKSSKKAKTTYTVKSGDSLSSIAAKLGTDAGSLQEANPKVDPSALHPGQKLKLPR